VKSVAELIALAKAKPGKLNAPVGLGSNIHLSTLSCSSAGRCVGLRPTKGGQSSVLSVMTGDGDFLLMGVIQTWVHVKSGRLKLIAVSSEQREPTFPNVPTVAETPDSKATAQGRGRASSPAKLPPEIVNKLYNEVKRIVALPLSEKLTALGSRRKPRRRRKWATGSRPRRRSGRRW